MNTKLLRQKILDLAIRGKLTEQKKSDGTTKDLLASIAASSACHAELVSASPSSSAKKNSKATERSVILSKRSASKDLAKEIIPLNKDEAPFEIPENWEWVRLGDLCSSVSSGKTPSTIQKELWNGDILWVTSKDVKQKYIHSTQVCLSELGAQTMRLYPENTMIIVGRSGILRHTLPVSILKHDATINQDLKALIFKDDNLAEYIHAAIKGMEQDLLHRYKKAGTTVDNLNFDEFLLAGIPLPPLAEQQRIVTAIENAFAEITAIENNQELLKKHIKQGRQKILDLAIRGKLTQQLKTDGTTKDLLTSIATASACHAELVSASPSSSAKKNSKATERSIILSKRSVSKDLAKEIIPLNKDEAPFEIPETWEWVKLGDLCSSVSSGKTPSTIQKELWNGDILWVTSKDVKQKYIHSTQVCLSELGAQTMRLYPENTMIIVGRSGILRHTLPVSILKHDATINQDLKALIFKDDNLAEYIHAAIKGMEQDLLHRYKKAGTTVDNLNFDEFLLAGIPLPPLAEQQRIVAAIESAFTEFDAMEKGVL